MDGVEFFKVLAQNPVVLVFLLICTSITLIVFLFLVVKAAKQGKRVAFWKIIKIGEDKNRVDKPMRTSSENSANFEESEEIYKIEGIWGDWSGTVEEPRASFLHIRRNGKEFVVEGKEYDKNYKVMGDWASDVSKFRKLKRRLEYLFEGTGYFTGDELVKADGYTTINFFGAEDKRPETYSGTYVDVVNPATGELRSGSFQGKRLTDKEKSYYFGGAETQRLIIDQLIRKATIRAKVLLGPKKQSKERAEE